VLAKQEQGVKIIRDQVETDEEELITLLSNNLRYCTRETFAKELLGCISTKRKIDPNVIAKREQKRDKEREQKKSIFSIFSSKINNESTRQRKMSSDRNHMKCCPSMSDERTVVSKKPLWIIAGLPGVGKTTLFTSLTGEKRATGRGAESITTKENAAKDAQHPVLDKTQTRYFCDTEGVGDVSVNDAKEMVAQSAPSLTRLVKGATGLILCTRHDRFLFQDKLVLRSHIQMCSNLPIVVACLKADECNKQIQDDIQKGKAVEWKNADEWVDKWKSVLAESVGEKPERFTWLSLAVEADGCEKLNQVLFKFDSNQWAGGDKLNSLREKWSITTGVNMEDAEMDRLWKASIEMATDIVGSNWFIELIKENFPGLAKFLVNVADFIRVNFKEKKKLTNWFVKTNKD